MTFNPNIPTSSNIPSQSQAQFLTNFGQLNTIFDVDHVTFNDATVANRGKHTKTTYIEWAMPPEATADPITSSNELALYSKESGSVSTLFLRKESNGTVIQMSGQDPTIATSGSTFLPGGIVLKWGQFSTNAGGTATPTFASAFPTACFVVVASVIDTGTPTTANSAVYAYNYSTTGFSATGTKRTALQALQLNASYIAIGN